MGDLSCEAYYFRIGNSIRRIRLAKGLTQEGLAELSGLSSKMIQKIELGKSGFRMETIIRIARALEVSLDVLADMRDMDERLIFQQEAFYMAVENKSVNEIRFAIELVDCIFRLQKMYLD